MKSRKQILYERTVKKELDKKELERTSLIYYPNYEKDIFIPLQVGDQRIAPRSHIPYIEKFCDEASELGLYGVSIFISDFSEAYYYAYVACLRKYTEKEELYMTEPRFIDKLPDNPEIAKVSLNSPEKSLIGRILSYTIIWKEK